MNVIYKYKLDFKIQPDGLYAELDAPSGQVLKVAPGAKGETYVWIRHPKDGPFTKTYFFRAVMTGEEISDDFIRLWSYFDTIFRNDGLVVHIYERAF